MFFCSSYSSLENPMFFFMLSALLFMPGFDVHTEVSCLVSPVTTIVVIGEPNVSLHAVSTTFRAGLWCACGGFLLGEFGDRNKDRRVFSSGSRHGETHTRPDLWISCHIDYTYERPPSQQALPSSQESLQGQENVKSTCLRLMRQQWLMSKLFLK